MYISPDNAGTEKYPRWEDQVILVHKYDCPAIRIAACENFIDGDANDWVELI